MTRLRTFYVLVATQIFSLIGSRMTGIAVGFKVFDDTGNTAPLLIAAFFAELPGMVGGTFTGLLADRWDRRYVIMLGDAGQAAGTLLLLVTFVTGTFELWHLYVAMLVQGVFGTIQGPASSAAITMLVPDALRDRANGLNEMGFPLAGVVAPVFAGLLYSVVGVSGVIAFDLLTFVTAVAVVARLHIPRPDRSAESDDLGGSFWREMLGGWRYLLTRRALLVAVIYIAFIDFVINGPLELALPYTVSVTGSESTAGLLLGAMSFGALAGAGTIALVGSVRQRMRIILTGYVALGGVFLLLGVVRHPVLLGAALFLVLFPLPLNGALFSSVLQAKTPPDLQGRVFAVTGQMFMLMTPFSFLITGALVDDVLTPAVSRPAWDAVAPLVGRGEGAGMGLLLIGAGLLILAATALVLVYAPVRRLETDLPDYAGAAAAAGSVEAVEVPAV